MSYRGDIIIQNLYVKHLEWKTPILGRIFRVFIDDDSLLLEVAGVSYWGEHAVKLLRTYARHPELTDLQLEVIDRLIQLESEKFY